MDRSGRDLTLPDSTQRGVIVEMAEHRRKHKKRNTQGRARARAGSLVRRRGEEGLVFHFFPQARRTKAIVEDPIVED